MLARAERCSRIDLNEKLVLVFLRNLLPGRLDQDIIHGKRLEILFPVVDPVLILCFTLGDGPLSQIRKHGKVIKSLIHTLQDAGDVLAVVEIEADKRHTLVRRQLRKDIDEHPLRLLRRKRNIVLDLDSLDSDLIKHAAD